MILAIAVPLAFRDDANQFARCVGYGPDDDKTFNHGPNAQDEAGGLYIFSSGWVGPNFIADATQPLTEPEWGCDLEAATRAQAMIAMDATAAPDRIVAWAIEDTAAAMAAMGLVAKTETQGEG
jgi:hypothetical protein